MHKQKLKIHDICFVLGTLSKTKENLLITLLNRVIMDQLAFGFLWFLWKGKRIKFRLKNWMVFTPNTMSHKPLVTSLLIVTIAGWWNSLLLFNISPFILEIKIASDACLLRQSLYERRTFLLKLASWLSCLLAWCWKINDFSWSFLFPFGPPV